jgi:hypothetical protein
MKLPFLFHSRYITRHFVVDVIWRLPVWNVKIRRYLASCTLQFGSNLTKIIFQGKNFNMIIIIYWNLLVYWKYFPVILVSCYTKIILVTWHYKIFRIICNNTLLVFILQIKSRNDMVFQKCSVGSPSLSSITFLKDRIN